MLPENIHQDEVATLIGLTTRRIEVIAKENGVNKTSPAHFNFAEIIRACIAEKEKKTSPAIERLNLAKAKREERKDAIEAGEIVTVEIVLKATADRDESFKQRMLRIGNNVQSKIGLNESQRKAIDIEVRDGLVELEKKLIFAAGSR